MKQWLLFFSGGLIAFHFTTNMVLAQDKDVDTKEVSADKAQIRPKDASLDDVTGIVMKVPATSKGEIKGNGEPEYRVVTSGNPVRSPDSLPAVWDKGLNIKGFGDLIDIKNPVAADKDSKEASTCYRHYAPCYWCYSWVSYWFFVDFWGRGWIFYYFPVFFWWF